MVIDYNINDVPVFYSCHTCGAFNVKLWRPIDELVNPELACANCAAADQHETISGIDADGRFSPFSLLPRSDVIGDYVPAVPIGDAHYWKSISVLPGADRWWRQLPSLPE